MALGLGLLATTWIAHREYQSLLQRRSDAIAGIVGRGDAALRASLHDGELLLRSVQTLFLASQDVSQEEFANIYANLQAHERLPSLQAMVFARRQVRADGEHFVTALVMPIAGNERVIGLDVVSQPGNLAGLLRSRDSDETVMSAPFRLAQQRPGELPDGVTLRLPVYSTGAPPRSVEERRRRMRGSIAISLRLNRMISTALRETAKLGLHVQILDVTDGRALPVYDSRPPDAKSGQGPWFERMHDYGGRRWQLRMYAAERLATVRWPWTIFAGGGLSSLLLALLVWSAATTRQRALLLGKRMSRSFRDSEARFRALNELLPAMVLLADRGSGRILYANQA
ncbi:MAG TPA: CHASE domain-containing protein, partial [Polyangiales bacterium]